MSETRRQIRDRIHTNAGVHFNELVRRSEFAPGQIQYHVRRLLDADELVRNEFYGQTHYYPPGYDEWERAVLALFRRETAREIVVYLIEHEPVDPATVAADLDIARSTLEYHLDRLTDHDVVEKRYDDRNRVSLRLANPDRTAPLLSEVTPTVPDRLVDRFTRLVDGLLENAPEADRATEAD
ncbi:winged helix-turn-helix transcriptional regulator [Halosolutus halophilus]|uniref:winged helix-turn-helix transcriptional regulator n=1 Tax=Halosolutus halophilus TaxID=1552990 RepID=UPI0022350F3A|nr:helix-turn-helix domain-containing protein [Halosolutus halophilus]